MSITSNKQQILGNYKIGKSIGQGTFGKVKLGIHILTEQKVAVKTLQKEKIIEQADIERVTRQICILKILRHPNIIQLYEIIQTKTDIHLIMQYASGGELFDYIVKKKRLDEVQATKFMQQIISGVQYIHKNGIVHRDLKPQNLLLDENNNIKIVDFGLSNQYKNGQKLKTACGSPCYAAPQMIAGKRYQCLNVDIWSCGIILYAMLCGYLPFQDPNTNKLYKKIISGDFQMPKILSSEARDILKNILNVNPQTRYKIPQIRESKWFNIIKPRYQAKGIIVGKDTITPQEQIIRNMQKFKIDPVQARTYVINNRHNHATALYYLLLQKQKKQGPTSVPQKQQNLKPQTPKQQVQQPVIQPQPLAQKQKQKDKQRQRQRQQSPLIYRPDKKTDYYISQKKSKAVNDKDQSKNDSLNVSNIISSLVEANKLKIINNSKFGKKTDGKFDKVEEFKLFPKKKNSSIHQSNTSKNTSINKNNIEESDMPRNSISTNQNNTHRFSISSSNQPHFNSTIKQNISMDERSQHSETHSNYKRQQLSQQLKQISVKIDKQIFELRKQSNNISGSNNNEHSNSQTKRDSITSQIHSINSMSIQNRKRPSQSLNISSNIISEKQTPKNGNFVNTISMTPKIHVGPFNTRCLFMQSASSLHQKIKQFLGRNNIRYQQNEPYGFQIIDNENIWIEAIQGNAGLHLINFSKNIPINDRLIDALQV